jgi:hypothetical protein
LYGFAVLIALHGAAAASDVIEKKSQLSGVDSPKNSPSRNATLEGARAAIARGDLSEGERLLALVDESSVDHNDLDFLRGTIAAAHRDYKTAIARFRAILQRDPSLNRVRLELARVYFLNGEDVAAEHHFRAVLAQGVPPNVQENINRFLDEIRRRKHWDVGVFAAVAPDSNVNAATTAQSVDLFGLPFQLNPTAQRQSGVGFTATLTGFYQWDVTHSTKIKAGGAYYDTEYGNDAFSDRNLHLYTGPRFLIGQGTEVSVLATGSKRWYGGAAFTDGYGVSIEGQTALSPRVLLGGTVEAHRLRYADAYADYTGPIFSANLLLTYFFDAHSFARVIGGIVREQARLEPLRDFQYVLGAGYYREDLPLGLAVYINVQGALIPYDAPLPALGRVRKDVGMDYRMSLSNRNFDVFGFTPLVSYIHTDRYSNISLYTYHRSRVEVGVTRNF